MGWRDTPDSLSLSLSNTIALLHQVVRSMARGEWEVWIGRTGLFSSRAVASCQERAVLHGMAAALLINRRVWRSAGREPYPSERWQHNGFSLAQERRRRGKPDCGATCPFIYNASFERRNGRGFASKSFCRLLTPSTNSWRPRRLMNLRARASLFHPG